MPPPKKVVHLIDAPCAAGNALIPGGALPGVAAHGNGLVPAPIEAPAEERRGRCRWRTAAQDRRGNGDRSDRGARRHARHEPVPAQLHRRYRAQPRAGHPPRRRRHRPSVERLLSFLRRGADPGRHRHRLLRATPRDVVVRGDHRARRLGLRLRRQRGGVAARPRAHGARLLELLHGAARGLRPLVLARPLLDAHRRAARRVGHGHARGNRAARLRHGHDRLAPELPRHRGVGRGARRHHVRCRARRPAGANTAAANGQLGSLDARTRAGGARAVARARVRHERVHLLGDRNGARSMGRAVPFARLRLRHRSARELAVRARLRLRDGDALVGPTDRLFQSYKKPVIIGALATVTLLAWLAVVGRPDTPLLVTWFVLLGLAAGFSPVLTAHNRALFPPPLMGRGLTVMNLGTMGGVFLMQALTGAVVGLFDAPGDVYPLDAYRAAFAVEALLLGLATLLYLLARDPRESGLHKVSQQGHTAT